MLPTKTYIKNIYQQPYDTKVALEKYLHLLKWNSNEDNIVADIGCGTGIVTWNILRSKLPKNVQIIGIDKSKDMIEYASKHFPSLEYIEMNLAIEKLPKNLVGHLNHIFSFYCFHWIPNQRKLMENVYGMLKPGGDILAIYLANHDIFEIHRDMAKNKKWKPYCSDLSENIPPYQDIKSPEEIVRKLLLNVGFQISICQSNCGTYVFNNVKELQGTFKKMIPTIRDCSFIFIPDGMLAVNPYTDRIPTDLKNEFVEEYFHRIQSKLIEDTKNHKIYLSYNLLTIVAHKNK